MLHADQETFPATGEILPANCSAAQAGEEK
jgi:hypothetical protein